MLPNKFNNVHNGNGTTKRASTRSPLTTNKQKKLDSEENKKENDRKTTPKYIPSSKRFSSPSKNFTKNSAVKSSPVLASKQLTKANISVKTPPSTKKVYSAATVLGVATNRVNKTGTSPIQKSISSTKSVSGNISTNGCVKTPKKITITGNNGDNKTSSKELLTKNKTSSKRASPLASKNQVSNKTPKKSNPVLLEVSTSNEVFTSPSMKQIPRNVVQNLVSNYEVDKPGSLTKNKVRKSLYQTFAEQRRSIIKRRSSSARAGETEISQIDFSVTVAVRVRPFNSKEADSKQVIFMDNNSVKVSDGQNIDHSFDYDYSFWSFDKIQSEFASQTFVYRKLAKPLLTAAFDGYNTCLFAYGQTGSGKSYTVMGYDEDVGIIPRFCDDLFSVANKISKNPSISFHVEMSYFEIYKEKIHDLLVSNPNSAEGETEVKKQALRVREHPEHGPYVEDLSTFVVRSFADIQVWLKVGNRQRATASTGMNDKSSRSHSVFVITMVRTTTDVLDGEEHKSCRRSRINLIDLAGSERSSTAQTTGQRLKEAASINKSLLTLGKVISALSERSLGKKKQVFVPYRDSVLTWLLKDSLGGNSRTAMIATVSPSDNNIEETLSTLRYASQARTIVNVVKINEDPNSKIIRELKAEIEKLKNKNSQFNMEEYRSTIAEVALLRNKLAGAEKERGEAEMGWKKKLELTEKRKAQEINELKRAGVSFKVDNCLPNLVNLNEDPQLSEMLLYVIKQGVTNVGKRGQTTECDIQLSGALVGDLHCKISNQDEVVTLTPVDCENYKTFVNGKQVFKPTMLHHGDRVIVGGDHFFRLNHPIEVQRSGKRKSKEQVKDFEFAKHEWIAAQTARMEKEIQNAKQDVEKQYKQTIDALLERDKAASQELEAIQEQKIALESEVSANRKRRDLEAKLLSEAKPVLDDSFSSDPLLLLVQAEKKRIQQDVERLQNNLKMQNTSPVHLNRSSSSDLMKLTTFIEEVNKISRELNKNMEFSVYENAKFAREVKVVNYELNIWTLWSVEKFEEKLELIREAYEDFKSGKVQDNEGIDNLFYDLSDKWNELCTIANPKQEIKSIKKPTRRSIRRMSSLILTRSSEEVEDCIAKPVSLTDIFSMCKNVIQSGAESDCPYQSVVDHMLKQLHLIYVNISKLSNKYSSDNSKDGTEIESTTVGTTVLEISLVVSQLQSSVVNFQLMKNEERIKACKNILQMTEQLNSEMKQMTFAVAKLLHGCENDLQQIVYDSEVNIKRHIANFSKCLGAVAISMKSSVTFIAERDISGKIKEAYIQGSDAYLRKTLRNKITKLSSSVKKCNDCDTKKLLENTASFLSTIIEFQEKVKAENVREILNRTFCLGDSSSDTLNCSASDSYYPNTYTHNCEMLKLTSALVSDAFGLQSIANIPEKAMKAIDLIDSLQRSTLQIGELCENHENYCNSLQESLKANSSNEDNSSDALSCNSNPCMSETVNSAGLVLCEGLDKVLNEIESFQLQSLQNSDSVSSMTVTTSDLINNNKVFSENSGTGTNTAISSAVYKWTGISERGSVSK